MNAGRSNDRRLCPVPGELYPTGRHAATRHRGSERGPREVVPLPVLSCCGRRCCGQGHGCKTLARSACAHLEPVTRCTAVRRDDRRHPSGRSGHPPHAALGVTGGGSRPSVGRSSRWPTGRAPHHVASAKNRLPRSVLRAPLPSLGRPPHISREQRESRLIPYGRNTLSALCGPSRE